MGLQIGQKLAGKKAKDVVYAEDLAIEWGDGITAHYPFFYLRDICPCANCIDEISGAKILETGTIPKNIHMTKVEYVGNYALKITWSDGHDTGLYSFSTLRELYDAAIEAGGVEGGPFSLQN